jgi:hypothetical protein
VTRHRLRAFFVQTRVHNRSLRLPWILWIWPTPVGERAWVWLVSGLSVEDFESSTERLAAACWARAARVERSRRYGSLVRVDIVRRDPLTATETIGSVLIPTTGTASSPNRVWGQPAGPGSSTGPLAMPSTVIDLSEHTSGRGKPVNKSATTGLGTARAGKAALSSQDGDVIPSTAPGLRFVARDGGEDVSDYV